MESTRAVVVGVAALIVAMALVSGPLVPGVSFTDSRQLDYGQGNATVEAVEFPETATIERGSFGSESYYLSVPAATARFGAFDGAPILTYRVAIPALNYSRSTAHFLSPETGATFDATLRSDTFRAERITADRYEGRLAVLIEDSAGRRQVAAGNVTVEVVR